MNEYVRLPKAPPFPKSYIAKGVRTVNGTSQDVYITYTEDGGGWHQWTTSLDQAKVFKTERGAILAAKACPGPWFNEPAKNTISAVPVNSKEEQAYTAFINKYATLFGEKGAADD